MKEFTEYEQKMQREGMNLEIMHLAIECTPRESFMGSTIFLPPKAEDVITTYKALKAAIEEK